MTKLIIHTNTKSLNDKGICSLREITIIKEIIKKGTELKFNDLIVKLRNDDKVPETIEGSKYIAIHNSKQNLEVKNPSITRWREKNKGVMVSGFSHSREPNTFYKDIIPKVLDKSLTLKNVLEYFPGPLELSLNLLHDIYSGISKSEFKKSDLYEDLLVESGAKSLIQEMKESWKYTESDIDVLNNLREKLLTYATKH